jgi:hypothetical protein
MERKGKGEGNLRLNLLRQTWARAQFAFRLVWICLTQSGFEVDVATVLPEQIDNLPGKS